MLECCRCRFGRLANEFPLKDISDKCLNHPPVCLACIILRADSFVDGDYTNLPRITFPAELKCPMCNHSADAATIHELWDQWRTNCMDSAFLTTAPPPILPAAPGKALQIKLGDISGREESIHLTAETTVDALMLHVQNNSIFKVPVANQVLTCNNRCISGIASRSSTLREAGLGHGAVVHLKRAIKENIKPNEELVVTLSWVFSGALVLPELVAFACSPTGDNRGRCEGFINSSNSRYNDTAMQYDIDYANHFKTPKHHGTRLKAFYDQAGAKLDPRIEGMVIKGNAQELRSHSQRIRINLAKMPSNITRVFVLLATTRTESIKRVLVTIGTDAKPCTSQQEDELTNSSHVLVCSGFSRQGNPPVWTMDAISTSVDRKFDARLGQYPNQRIKDAIAAELTDIANALKVQWSY